MSDDTMPETAVSHPEPSEEPVCSGDLQPPGAADASTTNGSSPRPDGAPRRRRRGSRGGRNRKRPAPSTATPAADRGTGAGSGTATGTDDPDDGAFDDD